MQDRRIRAISAQVARRRVKNADERLKWEDEPLRGCGAFLLLMAAGKRNTFEPFALTILSGLKPYIDLLGIEFYVKA
jgi:hypothetical protein